MLNWTNDMANLFHPQKSGVSLITVIFFDLVSMIKEILNIFIFSKIIVLSVEAHSYTYMYYYPWMAALLLKIQLPRAVVATPQDMSFPPSQKVCFCEMKTPLSPASCC